MRAESVVPAFLEFWSAAAGEPRDVQWRLWHELHEEPNRELFDLYYTNWASPDMLDAALDRFPAEAGRIAASADALPQRLSAAARATAAALKRPEPDLDVQLLVGLFSSDGWLADFRGRRTLFFAVEYLPSAPYDDVFFAHECAHVVHRATGFDGETVAAAVIAEGLAVAASEGLFPGHSEAAYLWMRDGRDEWLQECVAREDELRRRLRDDLDSQDVDTYARWFLGRPNESGLPSRSGYFVARRWMHELGAPLREIVVWDYAEARSSLRALS